MDGLSYITRAESLRRMSEQGVQVLVVGGGIPGAGVALDAAARGFRVGLVEKADFASGTSSKSTKLVHGGIRYLSQFDFGLTRESLVERGLLLRNAPFLVHPIGFVLPLYKGARRPMGTPIRPPFGMGMGYVMRAGLTMYDLMSGRLSIRRHRALSKGRVRRMVPCLRTEGLTNAFIYYDGQTDDTRLTMTVLRTAAEHGALLANYAEVIAFDIQDDRITGALVRDRASGAEMSIQAGVVVNAGGVFAGRIEEMAGQSNMRILPAKGVHLTVPREALQMGRYAVVLPETEDGRLLFLVPWGPRVTIGTTDTQGGDVDRPLADGGDIAYLLRHVNRYMDCDLREGDIISAWTGYRPLISSRDGSLPSSKLSRTHEVMDGPGGMVTIVGGKLTTYRRMAQDTVDRVSERLGETPDHVTRRLSLSGAAGWRDVAQELTSDAELLGLEPDIVQRLGAYGTHARRILDLVREEPGLGERVAPDLPYIMAEVVYACREEMATGLGDVLERRTHVSFEARDPGGEVAEKVAALIARELGWDTGVIARQLALYRQEIAGLSAWRS